MGLISFLIGNVLIPDAAKVNELASKLGVDVAWKANPSTSNPYNWRGSFFIIMMSAKNWKKRKLSDQDFLGL